MEMKHVWAMLASYHHSRINGVLLRLKYSRHVTGWKVRVCKRNHASKELYDGRYYSFTEMLTGLLTEMLTEILVEIFSKYLQHTMMYIMICTMMYITICSTVCSMVHARPNSSVMYHHVNGIFVKKNESALKFRYCKCKYMYVDILAESTQREPIISTWYDVQNVSCGIRYDNQTAKKLTACVKETNTILLQKNTRIRQIYDSACNNYKLTNHITRKMFHNIRKTNHTETNQIIESKNVISQNLEIIMSFVKQINISDRGKIYHNTKYKNWNNLILQITLPNNTQHTYQTFSNTCKGIHLKHSTSRKMIKHNHVMYRMQYYIYNNIIYNHHIIYNNIINNSNVICSSTTGIDIINLDAKLFIAIGTISNTSHNDTYMTSIPKHTLLSLA
ncbi:MAG: hypothetical protein OXC46_10600 [Thaumarchaeota archaeon]|nr:hypothetical protein [Nitrososphaerota archaeon]